MRPRRAIPLLAAFILLACADAAWADRIGDLSQTDWREQAKRFITLRDPAVRYALAGSVLLGMSCGLLGGFIVVRKMALFGDMLSHAVLPGVALGFLWNMSKDPVAIFVGATLAGLLGAAAVTLLRRTTRLKEDTALGIVLALFFAVGICMVTRIQSLPQGNKSGIDKFLFGQAAALGADDVRLMAIVTALAVVLVCAFYKELLLTSFDSAFAASLRLPVAALHYGLMLLLAFAVVVALQAVGVVLVSAMLITPAAAAYLLTDRLHRLLLYAMLFGVLAGVAGAFVSFLGNNLPTGPFMVLAASTVFALAFLFSPRHGVVMRWWRRRAQAQRIQRENTLKAIYHVLEVRGFAHAHSVSLHELAARRQCAPDAARDEVMVLARHGLARLQPSSGTIDLTQTGWQRACEIVRNHRLWEWYLAHQVSIAPDHVHADAENIEHLLGEEMVCQIEHSLSGAGATSDPHGRPIPSRADMQRPFGTRAAADVVDTKGRMP
ncbi:MAG: ABC transporter [Pedosphaera sp.]|nr:ABC transporter [Pedosphaera sp.]MSU44019.1 ABC transporter [Pedosphaera sp.]